MDQNRDWKLIVALVLGGLALLIALGGQRGYGNNQANPVPQQIIVQPVAPSTGGTGGTTAPVIPVPDAQPYARHHWGGAWPVFAFFPCLFFLGLIFLVLLVIGRGRRGWGGPGWYGRPWGGPGPGPGPGPQGPPQGQPYGQYPQGQGQPYQGYPQGQQPQQGQQSNQAPDAGGDITSPERSGDY